MKESPTPTAPTLPTQYTLLADKIMHPGICLGMAQAEARGMLTEQDAQIWESIHTLTERYGVALEEVVLGVQRALARVHMGKETGMEFFKHENASLQITTDSPYECHQAALKLLRNREPREALTMLEEYEGEWNSHLVLLAMQVLNELGEYARAMQVFTRFQGEPDDHLLQRVVMTLMCLKKSTDAVAFLEGHTERVRQNPFLCDILLGAYDNAGETENMQHFLEEAVALHPKDPRLASRQAFLLITNGQTHDAEGALKRLSKADQTEACRRVAERIIITGKSNEALAFIGDKSASMLPRPLAALRLEALCKLGRHEQVIAEFQKCTPPQTAEMCISAAGSYFFTGSPEKALEILEKHKEARSRTRYGATIRALALQKMQRYGEMAEAIPHSLSKTNAMALSLKVAAHNAQGDYAVSAALLDAYTGTWNVKLVNKQAGTLARVGRLADALAALESLPHEQWDKASFAMYAWVLTLQGKAADAYACLNDYRKAHPEEWDAVLAEQYLNTMLAAGKMDEAEKFIKQTDTMPYNSASTRASLEIAAAYFRGSTEEVRQQLLSISGGFRYRLAIRYARLALENGSANIALAYITPALQAEPESPEQFMDALYILAECVRKNQGVDLFFRILAMCRQQNMLTEGQEKAVQKHAQVQDPRDMSTKGRSVFREMERYADVRPIDSTALRVWANIVPPSLSEGPFTDQVLDW